MSIREPRNSQALQKKFPLIYRDFFAKCQKVASAPNSFLWSGEFSGFYDRGLMISQKLPFRIYIGFESASHGMISIDSEYQAYDLTENGFAKKVLENEIAVQFKSFLATFFKGKPDFGGLNVHILAEAPLGHGVGSNGALAAALTKLIADDLSMEEQLKVARQVLSGSQKGYSSGVSAYNALVPASQPILFFSKDGGFSAYPITEIAKAKVPVNWPIDFGLIYSGVQTNSESVVLSTEHTMKELSEASESVGELLSDYNHPPFQKTFLDMLNMTSGLMVNAFTQIFLRGSNDLALRQFFNTINQYQNLLHILDISTKTADSIYRRIHELAKVETNGSGSGVKISGIGKGGAMLFALPYGIHRRDILELIEKLRIDLNGDICLEYASWLDGVGEEEAKIEQDIAANQISLFLAKDTILLSVFDHGKRTKQIVTGEHFIEIHKENDIVFDKTTGKIFVAGDPLSSRELPSQKASVMILSELLDSSDYSLLNEKISDSYGKNRYDLQGKIVIPLKKQVKEKTGRDLQLSVTGGTYDNYRLTIDPSNISIVIAEEKK